MNVRPIIDPVADRALRDLPDGMLEFFLEQAIIDYRRMFGFDEAREKIAEILLRMQRR